VTDAVLWKTARFHGRPGLANLCNQLGLVSSAVEIGTHRGLFAYQFMKRWRGKKLYCVDPYLSGYCAGDPASHGDREADKQAAINRLADFQDRVEFINLTSVEAATQFDDCSLDFAYIDAMHTYEAVLEDLTIWWPKVRAGGILSGHDIVKTHKAKGRKGWAGEVRPAVEKFAGERNLTVWIVHETKMSGVNGSYYIKRSGT